MKQGQSGRQVADDAAMATLLGCVVAAGLALGGCRDAEPTLRLVDPDAPVPHNVYGNPLVRPGDAMIDAHGFPVQRTADQDG
ncbi:hypothetical protein [Zavarzinia sp. CC-PAN008]|uniref:hypothetical protein n=1 Tax=Zavarzinia sp. CC-PAN008 TaxID=3243332 RepID=UPI003F74669D